MSRPPSHLAIWHDGKNWNFRAGDAENSDFASGRLDATVFEDAIVEVCWRLQFPENPNKMPIIRKDAELAMVKKGLIGT